VNIQQDILSSPIAVSRVDETGIVVTGQRFESSLLFGSRLQPQTWDAADTANFEAAARSLVRIFGDMQTVVLLGTGSKLVFPPVEVRRIWAQAGLSVEVMDTAAACRTFNLLVGEGRDAHAALLLGVSW
jgi:uncharacterized protein